MTRSGFIKLIIDVKRPTDDAIRGKLRYEASKLWVPNAMIFSLRAIMLQINNNQIRELK